MIGNFPKELFVLFGMKYSHPKSGKYSERLDDLPLC